MSERKIHFFFVCRGEKIPHLRLRECVGMIIPFKILRPRPLYGTCPIAYRILWCIRKRLRRAYFVRTRNYCIRCHTGFGEKDLKKKIVANSKEKHFPGGQYCHRSAFGRELWHPVLVFHHTIMIARYRIPMNFSNSSTNPQPGLKGNGIGRTNGETWTNFDTVTWFFGTSTCAIE